MRIGQRGDGGRMQLDIDERLLAEVRALFQVGEVNFKAARRRLGRLRAAAGDEIQTSSALALADDALAFGVSPHDALRQYFGLRMTVQSLQQLRRAFSRGKVRGVYGVGLAMALAFA